MGQPRRTRTWTREIQTWELELCAHVAQRFEKYDPDELEAELAQQLLHLKRSQRKIHNWPGYLNRTLRNEASDWSRRRREEQQRAFSLDKPLADFFEDSGAGHDIIEARDLDPAEQAALARAFDALAPDHRRTWLALLGAEGNQTRAARMLRIHRNTLHNRLRQIAAVFLAHGYRPNPTLADRTGHASTGDPRPRRALRRDFITVRAAFWSALMRQSLSGGQWRVLLALILQIHKRKQKLIRVNWCAMAKMLCIGRSTAWRAVGGLLRTGICFIKGRAIGLRRSLAHL